MSNLPSRKTRPAATSMELRIADCGLRIAGFSGWLSLTEKPRTPSFPSDFGFQISASSPSDAFINEAQPFHFRRIEKIASVEHDRMRESLANPVEVELFKLFPFGRDHQRVAILRHFVHVIDV